MQSRNFVQVIYKSITVWICAGLITIAGLGKTYAADSKAELGGPYTIEYNYTIKYGYVDEWLDLYKRNHWPLLVAELERGHMLDIKVEVPRSDPSLGHRWDVRTTITWKNILLAKHLIDRDRDEIIQRLFPNQEQWKKEEQRRFKLLENISTTETRQLDTTDWPK